MPYVGSLHCISKIDLTLYRANLKREVAPVYADFEPNWPIGNKTIDGLNTDILVIAFIQGSRVPN